MLLVLEISHQGITIAEIGHSTSDSEAGTGTSTWPQSSTWISENANAHPPGPTPHTYEAPEALTQPAPSFTSHMYDAPEALTQPASSSSSLIWQTPPQNQAYSGGGQFEFSQ